MYLFPLGLGFKIRQIPWVTVLLALSMVWCHIFVFEDSDKTEAKLDKIEKQTQYRENLAAVFLEFCKAREFEDKDCSRMASRSFPVKSDKEEKSKTDKEADSKDAKSPTGAEGSPEDKSDEKTGEMAPAEKESGDDKRDFAEEFELMASVEDLFQDFFKEMTSPEEIKDLQAYSAFAASTKERKKLLKEFYVQEDLLSKVNVKLKGMWQAMFRHAGYLHLFGNLVIFVIFGIYVEIRMGAAMYAMMYLAGGVVGLLGHVLFFSSSDTYIVGASANVSAVMGAFYVLFRKFQMKIAMVFLVFPIKTFFVSTVWFFPLFFIIGEAASAMDSLDNPFGGVAHWAHLFGMGVGAAFALVESHVVKIQWPFISEKEMEETLNLKKADSGSARLKKSLELLKANPENIFARYSVCATWIENSNSGDVARKEAEAGLAKELVPLLAIYRRNGEGGKILALLQPLSLNFPLEKALKGIGMRTLLEYADLALDQKDYRLAIRLYSSFLGLFPKSPKGKSIKKTAFELVGHFQQDSGQQDWWSQYQATAECKRVL